LSFFGALWPLDGAQVDAATCALRNDFRLLDRFDVEIFVRYVSVRGGS
jgi:hypothetical protein